MVDEDSRALVPYYQKHLLVYFMQQGDTFTTDIIQTHTRTRAHVYTHPQTDT